MAGALGLVLTGNTVLVAGQHAVPVYVDDSLPIVGPSRACVISTGDIPFAGGPPIAVRLAPAGTPAVGPAIPVYVVPGGGILDTLAYTKKIQAMGPIGYWPQAESGGAVALDESGNGRNGAYTAVTLGQPGIGDGRTAASFDGSTSRNNVYSASLAAAFNGQEVSLMGWFQVSAAGIWTDAASRRLMFFQADASNRVWLERTTVNNQIAANYFAGGTNKTASSTALAGTLAWFHFALTVTKAGDAFKVFINGVQSGATQTGLGTFAGALSSTLANVGCTGANTAVWSGNIAHVAIFARALTAAEVLSAATL